MVFMRMNARTYTGKKTLGGDTKSSLFYILIRDYGALEVTLLSSSFSILTLIQYSSPLIFFLCLFTPFDLLLYPSFLSLLLWYQATKSMTRLSKLCARFLGVSSSLNLTLILLFLIHFEILAEEITYEIDRVEVSVLVAVHVLSEWWIGCWYWHW